MHRLAEIYDKTYREHESYNMKKWRQDTLREWLASRRTSRTMLDVGCGRGESLAIAQDLGIDARGCEIAPFLTGERVDLLEHGARKLPYETDAFDLVTCLDVMEHIYDEEIDDSILEMRRVCRGTVLLGIACKISDNPLHVTQRAPDWWADRIRKIGLKFSELKVPVPAIKRPYVFFELP